MFNRSLRKRIQADALFIEHQRSNLQFLQAANNRLIMKHNDLKRRAVEASKVTTSKKVRALLEEAE